MIIDITERLKFDKDPVIVVKGVELTVNSDALVVLNLLALSKEMSVDPAKIEEAVKLLFDEKNLKKLESMKLKMKDFMVVVQEGMKAAMGAEEEGQTP